MNPTQSLVLLSIMALAACGRPPEAMESSSGGIPGAVGSRQSVSLSSESHAAVLQYAALEAEHKPLPRAQKTGGAGTKTESRQEANASIAGNDLNFIQRVSNDSQAREQAALYVASKTPTDEVRDYAARMGQELGAANAQLRRLAAKRSIETPADPVGMLREKLDRLRQLSGKQMDQAFLRDFGTEANMDSIALFEVQQRQSDDKEMQEFIGKHLPEMREHYRQGKALRDKYAPASSASRWTFRNGVAARADIHAREMGTTGI
jgi:putative membrane protein